MDISKIVSKLASDTKQEYLWNIFNAKGDLVGVFSFEASSIEEAKKLFPTKFKENPNMRAEGPFTKTASFAIVAGDGCPKCGNQLIYDDGRDAWTCQECSLTGPNAPASSCGTCNCSVCDCVKTTVEPQETIQVPTEYSTQPLSERYDYGTNPHVPQKIGFWHSQNEPQLPKIQESIDYSWSRDHRSVVASYLKNGTVSGRYKGWSNCRICGVKNGSSDLTDGAYVWPEGLVHYVEAHHIKPNEEFVSHVLARIAEDQTAQQEQTGVVRKTPGKDEWCVKSEKNPSWSGGCYPSKAQAEKRLQTVEFFKHKK